MLIYHLTLFFLVLKLQKIWVLVFLVGNLVLWRMLFASLMLHNLFLIGELETCFSKRSNFSYIIYANLITSYALMKVNSYANQRYFYLSSVFSEAACVMAYQILLFSLLPLLPSQGVPGFLVADTFEKKQCILQRFFSHEKIQGCST